MSNDFAYGSTHIDQSVLLLDSIVFDEGYVKFIKTAGNRADMGIFNTSGIPALAGFKVVNNSGKIVSQFNFVQSYNAKLKLDAVQEQVGATAGRRWDFKYFPGGNVDFFTSSVDHWGYYNGASNGTALPNANWASLELFPQGSANRTSNAAFSKEGVLSEIRYPTGGSTSFEYEPNQLRVKYKSSIDNLSPFLLWPTNTFPVVTASVANGDSRNAGTWSGSFTLDSTTLLDFNFYRQLDPGYVWDSDIDFTGPSAGVSALESALNSVASLPPVSTATRPVTLPAGTYNWSCNTGKDTYASPMTDLYCFFSLTYTYMDTSALKPPFELPGLRIKKVVSRDSSSVNPPIIKEYIYHDSLQNVRLRNVPYYITSVYRWLYDQFNCLPCGTEYTIASESVAPFVGATIEYGKVTELYDSSGRGGKIDYSYMLSSDTKGGEMVQPQVMPFYASWEAGNLLSKRTYKKTVSGYDLVQLDTNTYVTAGGEGYMPGLRVGYSNVCNATIYGPNGVTSYRMNSVPIATVQFYQNSSTTRLFTNDTITNVKNLGYTSSSHYQQTLVEEFDSEGQSIRDQVVFAKDYPNRGLATAGDALGIRKVADTNLFVPIEVVRIKKVGGVDYVVGATLTTYRSDMPLPAKVYGLRLAAPITLSSFISSTINGSGVLVKDPNYEERLSYDKYDTYGNIIEMQEKHNLKKTVIWGYKSMYPIAEIWGADSGSCAYTSFEEDGNGLWTVGATARITTEGLTGNACYQLSSGNLTKSGLNTGAEYVLTYWTKNASAFAVAGTQGSAQMTLQAGAWRCFTHRVSGVAQVVLSGTGLLDEVRLYPVGGQMTTRCMEPMVGMICECSPNNRMMYFEYDALRRLVLVRDQNRNIIKKAEYQFGFSE
ncbi:hypothetical protein WJU16_03055 [Chitinophaga pollutisoli]|uniref:YD repeat-containing protein n=1 Tax=Chitinophaga pollutisoli TaxID=3133966 RepID=A0ABZ2YRC7_9BACT